MRCIALLGVSTCLMACAAPNTVVPDAAVTSAPEPFLPVFIFWREADLPPSAPIGVATLVADGYLVTVQNGIEDVLNDTRTDPRVRLRDAMHDRWYEGKIVMDDLGGRSGIVIIRADIPETPMRVATAAFGETEPEEIVGYAMIAKIAMPRYRRGSARECKGRSGVIRGHRYRGFGPRDNAVYLSGSPMLDREGKVLALKIFGPENPCAPIVHWTSEIRALFGLYFASWGRDLKKKPLPL